MKKFAAVLGILAVLNPLCCCWSFAGSNEATPSKSADHACCKTETDSEKCPQQGHDSTTCEHEAIKKSLVQTDSNISLPAVPVIQAKELFKEAADLQYHQQALKAFEKSGATEPFIEDWISVQTDCVRRL